MVLTHLVWICICVYVSVFVCVHERACASRRILFHQRKGLASLQNLNLKLWYQWFGSRKVHTCLVFCVPSDFSLALGLADTWRRKPCIYVYAVFMPMYMCLHVFTCTSHLPWGEREGLIQINITFKETGVDASKFQKVDSFYKPAPGNLHSRDLRL